MCKEMEKCRMCGAKWRQQGHHMADGEVKEKKKYLGRSGMWWGKKKSPIWIWLPLSVFPVLAVFENLIIVVVNKMLWVFQNQLGWI